MDEQIIKEMEVLQAIILGECHTIKENYSGHNVLQAGVQRMEAAAGKTMDYLAKEKE